MHIRGGGGRHLAALHFGDPAIGIHDEDIDRVEPFEGFNRRRARVAGGRAHDCYPFSRPAERCLKQLANELHGEIFEGQGRPMEQLQQEVIGPQLHQRSTGVMAETLVSSRDDGAEFLIGERIPDKRPHHGEGQIFIALTAHRGDRGVVQRGNGLGQVEPAVAR